jgi:hypothetical protein
MRNKPADILYGGLDAEKIQNAHPKFHEEHMGMFRQFVIDRYLVHLNKDYYRQPKPWTNNPILQNYKFTNVRREHDKTTIFLLNMLEEHKNDSYGNKVMNIILYRLFNKIETSQLIGWVDFKHYNSNAVRSDLSSAKPGFVYFTNAFYTTGMRQGFRKYYPEEEFQPIIIADVCNDMKHEVFRAIKKARSPQGVIDALKLLNGVGNFLSYQMFVDFTYLSEFPWSENEFVVSGPGCIKGLSELFEDRDGLSWDELLFWLRDNCPITREECMELMVDLPEEDRYMNLMSLENCMCELSKYIRAAEGRGRPKNLYNGLV